MKSSESKVQGSREKNANGKTGAPSLALIWPTFSDVIPFFYILQKVKLIVATMKQPYLQRLENLSRATSCPWLLSLIKYALGDYLGMKYMDGVQTLIIERDQSSSR